MNKKYLVFLFQFFLVFQTFSKNKDIPGISYTHILKKKPKPMSIHVLEVDPSKFGIEIKTATGSACGRDYTSDIAKENGALAAINGGFYDYKVGRIQKVVKKCCSSENRPTRFLGKVLNNFVSPEVDQGEYDELPSGILRIKKKWFSTHSLNRPCRGTIGWSEKDFSPIFARLSMLWKLKVGDKVIDIDDINAKRGEGKSILYTSSFSNQTYTDPNGVEVVIKKGEVIKIDTKIGNNEIPVDGCVFSFGKNSGVNVSDFHVGQKIKIAYKFLVDEQASNKEQQELWNSMDYIIEGAPLLIKNGKILENLIETEKVRKYFVIGRHPRTALGIKENGNWIFVVVDGRNPKLSVGITLPELSEFLLSLGCVNALNLDGGGSSLMFFDDNILNRPSDPFPVEKGRYERKVSNAILVFPKEL